MLLCRPDVLFLLEAATLAIEKKISQGGKDRILVTGASGFIGTQLVGALERLGFDLVTAGRSSDYRKSNSKHVRVGDITTETDWSEALVNVRCVVHLAARVHDADGKNERSLDIYRRTNVFATRRLAQQAADSGVERFIFLSTIKVHGEYTDANSPFDATSKILPDGAYPRSKYEAEIVLREIESSSNMKVTVIRPPLVYGPGVRGNFQRLIRLVATGIPLPLGALTRNRRSMVSSSNLIDLIIVCLNHRNAPGGTFLVSDGVDFSTAELVSMIAAANGIPTRLFPIPLLLLKIVGGMFGYKNSINRLSDSLVVDISQTIDTLNWRPKVSLRTSSESFCRGLKL